MVCSIPTYDFEVSSMVVSYNKEKLNQAKAVKKTMEKFYDKPSTTHGVSNGWTFSVGSRDHIDTAIEQITWRGSNLIGGEVKLAAYYPYNRENAKRTIAVRMAKRAAGETVKFTHQMFDFSERCGTLLLQGV